MKGFALIVAAICLLALAAAGQAANLDAGWYASIAGITMFQPDPIYGAGPRAAGRFTTSPGQ